MTFDLWIVFGVVTLLAIITGIAALRDEEYPKDRDTWKRF